MDDPKKSFSPSKKGVILGVHYNTVTWRWKLPQEKLDRILNMIWDLFRRKYGGRKCDGKSDRKIGAYPESRFYMSAILKL